MDAYTNTYTPEDATAAVERGAAWMDEHCHDWIDRINIAELRLRDAVSCVLGQTATCIVGELKEDDYTPGYYRVLDAYADVVPRVIELGFNIPLVSSVVSGSTLARCENNARYEMLTIAWTTCIQARREAMVVA